MATYEFYSAGQLRSLSVRPLDEVEQRIHAGPIAFARRVGPVGAKAAGAKKGAGKKGGGSSRAKAAEIARATTDRVDIAVRAALAQVERAKPFHATAEAGIRVIAPTVGRETTLVTHTVAVSGAKKSELKWLKDHYGMQVLRDGLEGKYLLKVPEGGDAGLAMAFEAARAFYEKFHVEASHPNFIRLLQQVLPQVSANQPLWNQYNTGNPGLAGADVAAREAWIMTRGCPDIRVAVIDEGVDTEHPALKAAVVAQKDYVDGHPNAMPDGDDAHGTACAGIIFSHDSMYPGLAPECGLVAVRIAKGDGNHGWIFDDFATADAIDWAWNEAKADVISCSWGGGPAVDIITRAIGRALSKGRGGKGSVVVFASGNNDGPVNYPGTLPEVVTVGASNQWDERKSIGSEDGESWWGSNFGKPLDLLAPGVRIATTDIHGTSGYSGEDFVLNFNGTSSATPHVAAAAALVLCLAPQLTGKKVANLINASVDRLSPKRGWTAQFGFGRLNMFAALRLARREWQ
jgi:subtilisin family serine protease